MVKPPCRPGNARLILVRIPLPVYNKQGIFYQTKAYTSNKRIVSTTFCQMLQKKQHKTATHTHVSQQRTKKRAQRARKSFPVLVLTKRYTI